jgi:diacylglycerol kinase (ATP)
MENNPRNGFSFSKFFRSFKYALSGIVKVFRSEPNFRIHTLAAIIAVSAGFYFHITKSEWLAVIITITLVFTVETINSAFEKFTDLVSPGHHPLAGWVKDVAAAAVLITAVGAAIVGLVVFVPYLVAAVGF